MGNKEIIKEAINDGRTALGIEFGSTRIKAVLVTDTNEPVAQGAHDWENRYENGIWTYSLDDIYTGLRHCYSELREDVKNKYGITLTNIGAIGFSAMMHGYMAFNENDELLVPFRTWRNTITEQASDELTKLFNYHIPQRWSIAHLYQAVLNNETHVGDIRFITTLAGMFIFRGFGRLVLDNKTVSIQSKPFLNVFTSYINIPGLDDGKKYSALIVGVLIACYIIFSTMRSRANKAKKGYRQNTAASDYSRAAVIAVVILWYCYKLYQYKGISVMLVWVVAICMIYNFITSKTAFGRYFYAIGGNEKATQLSGIDTNKVYFIAYANMGLLAGLAGLLCAARVGSVNGSTGTSFEMDAIGSCFIGGASAYGGSGTVGGVVIGALLLGVINMGMSIMGIGDSWQYVVKGAVLLIAVVFDVLSSRKNG